MNFLLHKDKEGNLKTSTQKQDCGCPSQQPSLRNRRNTFFARISELKIHIYY